MLNLEFSECKKKKIKLEEKLIKKILVANRAEIACRIIHACRELGKKSVAIYSEIDANSLHTDLADESYSLGGKTAGESYLNQDKIIQIAKESGCDAIHPGYGFLSENAEFNRKVREAGLIFIGPKPEAMELLGSKVRSRETMIEANVPVVPGMKSSSDDISEFEKLAEEMEFPVLIKSSAGGGGKGMRVVREINKIKEAVESSMRESHSAFGSSEVFMEKYIEQPRHIEFQVAADHHGNYIHVFERECSIQRRHQKIIEESPSVALNDELRTRMAESAIKAVKAANYDSVGTVEFLLDDSGNYYFLEVNARIQVEHPITEEVTGIDLVKLQIEIAEGKELPIKQEDISQRGHAIECRIYAEDGDNNFLPSSGTIVFLKEPTGKGIRFDSGIKKGSEVSVFYDPILAKLITHGANREEARLKMINALNEMSVLGVKTSIDFMVRCLEHKDFIDGKTYTNFINKNEKELNKVDNELLNLALSIGAIIDNKGSKVDYNSTSNAELSNDPWDRIGNWRIYKSKEI